MAASQLPHEHQHCPAACPAAGPFVGCSELGGVRLCSGGPWKRSWAEKKGKDSQALMGRILSLSMPTHRSSGWAVQPRHLSAGSALLPMDEPQPMQLLIPFPVGTGSRARFENGSPWLQAGPRRRHLGTQIPQHLWEREGLSRLAGLEGCPKRRGPAHRAEHRTRRWLGSVAPRPAVSCLPSERC